MSKICERSRKPVVGTTDSLISCFSLVLHLLELARLEVEEEMILVSPFKNVKQKLLNLPLGTGRPGMLTKGILRIAVE